MSEQGVVKAAGALPMRGRRCSRNENQFDFNNQGTHRILTNSGASYVRNQEALAREDDTVTLSGTWRRISVIKALSCCVLVIWTFKFKFHMTIEFRHTFSGSTPSVGSSCSRRAARQVGTTQHVGARAAASRGALLPLGTGPAVGRLCGAR